MWRRSRLHTELVTAKNYSSPIRLDGGRRDRDIEQEVELRIIVMDHETIDSHEDFGIITYDKITFQVSGYEMDKKDFYVKTGKTYIEWNGEMYRVNDVTDYTNRIQTSLVECKAVRRLHAD